LVQDIDVNKTGGVLDPLELTSWREEAVNKHRNVLAVRATEEGKESWRGLSGLDGQRDGNGGGRHRLALQRLEGSEE
jgi:hypothetical protein